MAILAIVFPAVMIVGTVYAFATESDNDLKGPVAIVAFILLVLFFLSRLA